MVAVGPWRHAVPALGWKSITQWISIDILNDALHIIGVQIDTPATACPDGHPKVRTMLGGMEVLPVEFHGCKTFEITDDGANIRWGAPNKKVDMFGQDRAGVNTIMFDSANGGKRHANSTGLDSCERNGFVHQGVLGEFSLLDLFRGQSSACDGTSGFQFGGGATGVKQIPGCHELRP